MYQATPATSTRLGAAAWLDVKGLWALVGGGRWALTRWKRPAHVRTSALRRALYIQVALPTQIGGFGWAMDAPTISKSLLVILSQGLRKPGKWPSGSLWIWKIIRELVRWAHEDPEGEEFAP
eukprot:scaffold23973_cov58-Attheya_sp.AAC.3